MTDVLLVQTLDGGDIEFINGVATMSDGLETAAYLSLFGGNEYDEGLEGDVTREWWGNKGEPQAACRLRSRTQALVRSIPLISSNLVRIKDAAENDLAWMLDTGLAAQVSAFVTIPALNRVRIAVNIIVQDEAFSFVFTEGSRAA